jgi:hypothetical protein
MILSLWFSYMPGWDVGCWVVCGVQQGLYSMRESPSTFFCFRVEIIVIVSRMS